MRYIELNPGILEFDKLVYSAYFSDGSVCNFFAPQTWSHVFAFCKHRANSICTAANIYCHSGGQEVYVRGIGKDNLPEFLLGLG